MTEGAAVNTARRSDTLSVAIVLSHVVFTYAPVYLAAALEPGWILLVLWLWFGWFNGGLINLMHECAHYLTFRRRWANDLLGGWLLAPLVFTDFVDYRQRHWEHHRELGTPKDPKLVYRTNLQGLGLLALAARCAIGLEAVKRLTERPEQPTQSTTKKSAALTPRLIIVHALFAGSLLGVAYLSHGNLQLALFTSALAYAFVYAYGLGSLTIFAAALRAIAEHQLCDPAPARRGGAALRNLKCNPLTRLMFGAYGFAEHATHHSEPGLPYYSLGERTRELSLHNPALSPTHGYLKVLRNCMRPQPRPQTASAER